ncbi:MAG: PKD domain-containing protein [Thermoplasmata archaeon]
MCLSMARAGGDGQESTNVAYSEATDGEYVTVGWTGDFSSWNPLTPSVEEDFVACHLIHSSLFVYDENYGGPTYDLANSFAQIVNVNGTMTTIINITHNAYFRAITDPYDTSHRLTANDVAFTFNLIMNNPGSSWIDQFIGVAEVRALDEYTVSITTTSTKATLIDDLAGVPIVPEYLYGAMRNPLDAIDPDDLVGSGPFMFDVMLAGSWYRFTTAPNYHGEADFGSDRSVSVPGVTYLVYADAVSMAFDMNMGTLDAVSLGDDTNLFLEILGNDASVSVIKQVVSEPGICDVAINAIPMSFRTATYGNGNPHLLDPVVRQALLMTMDKGYIVNGILRGLATEADSVIQPGYWHHDIENELPYDPAAARALLIENGYGADTDGDGYLEATAEAYVVREGLLPVGSELSGIRCQAPNTNNNYYLITQVWTYWAGEAGIGLEPSVESEGVMINQAWYKADYDIWVWHWGWGLEPIEGALITWLTSGIGPGGTNCQMPMGPWWYNDINYTDAPDEWGITGAYSAYDQNISLALDTMDREERRIIVDKLQQWVYDSYTETPPYYDFGLYAYTDARFVGWGDWTSHPGMTFTSGLPWLWLDLAPRGENLPPVFDTPLLPAYEAVVGEEIVFEVVVSDPDGDSLLVNWSFGDGEVVVTEIFGTSAPQVVRQSHVYSAPAAGLELWVTLHDGVQGHQVLSQSIVVVTDGQTTQRTVNYQWHDMFQEPFGDWWDYRYMTEVLSDSYPFIYGELSRYEPGTIGEYRSSMQLEVDANNLPEVSMEDDPQFLPYLGTERGGTATINWYLQYITPEEAQEWSNVFTWYDGWWTRLSGTTELDLTAAKAVMGITDGEFEDFDAWWAYEGESFKYAYTSWMYDEAERLGVFSMYEWPLQIAVDDISASKYNDTVVIEYNIISWGMEALMTKWLHEAFMPTEWYFEDFLMHAVISPDSADIDISTAVTGAVFGWKDISTGRLSWAWRGMLQDILPSSGYYGPSDFDIYQDKIYMNMYAGSPLYGEWIPFDYTPGAFNLSEGERMSFEWPDGPQLFIDEAYQDNVTTAVYHMASPYSEPSPYDFPSMVSIDEDLRTLTFEGPLDMYTWSMEQTAHDHLASEWDRVGLLPYGIPWIEFQAETETSEPYVISLENIMYHVVVGEPVGVTVTVTDRYGNPCTDYRGTLSFSSTDASALLPEDYTFTAEDAGTHYFEVVFGTVGDQWLAVWDAENANLSTGIWFDVRLPYEVDMYEPDDYYALASVIEFGEVQTHSIVPEWDDDYVTFTLAEPTSVEIRTIINGSGDTVMTLYDEAGVPYSPIAYDDDSGGGLSSLITADLPQGTYWVSVSAFGGYSEVPVYYILLSETQNVNLPPYAYMYWWPSEPSPGQEVYFDGWSSYDPDGWITQWLWDFGDGSTGEWGALNHTFYEAGEYNVTLTVVDNEGAAATTQSLIYVHENAPPVAALTYMPENPDPYDTVFFDAGESYDPDGWIEYYRFEFGNGDLVWTWYPEVSYTYYYEGVYTVTLTVYDGGGASGTTSVDVRVGGEPAPPVAIIGYLPPLPLVGEGVTFNASHSFDPDGAISTYTWQFGDGCVAEGMTVTHVYEHEGVYEVRLTVMDNDMMVDQDWANLTVASVPVASIVHTPLVPDTGETVTFYAYGSYDEGGIIEYAWSLGDGTYALGWQIEHVYVERGDYIVTLTVTNVYGVQDSATVTIEVGDIGAGVRGVVVSEALRPLRSAAVEVMLNGMTVASTLTGTDGSFLIRGLTPGAYDLVISKKGYADVSISVTIGEGVLDVGTIVLMYDKGASSSAILTPESSLLIVEVAAALSLAMLGALVIWKRRR